MEGTGVWREQGGQRGRASRTPQVTTGVVCFSGLGPGLVSNWGSKSKLGLGTAPHCVQ